MTDDDSAMFQTHPLNANGKLLRRFYEPLILLGVLDPTRGAQRPDLITDRGLDEPSKLWRNFLDQLSWLCDAETGGDTVTAVAAQNTVECTLFWVAANSTSRHKAHRQLTWLFEQLNHLCTTDPIPSTRLEGAIVAQCIEFSSRRVKAYTGWLLQAIRKGKRVIHGNNNPEDRVLLKELHEFEKLADDPTQLCAFAHDARRHDFMQILSRRHQAHSSRGVWSDIRHYIGRLGSWIKAVRILFQCALRFPQRIENAQVKVIDPCGLVDQPNKDHLTGIDEAIRRMVPARHENLAEDLIRALRDIDLFASINNRFCENYLGVRPRPHAELLVLEHFHQNDFEFVGDDRYIGCSKPSCYCCHLYMQRHPGEFTPRPCHGNLWINWAPPIPLPSVDPRQTTKSRPQEHHTFKMIQEMIPRIRQDLQDQVLSKRPRRTKLPDSTTGMSSVMLMAAQTMAAQGYSTQSLMPASAFDATSGLCTPMAGNVEETGPDGESWSHDEGGSDWHPHETIIDAERRGTEYEYGAPEHAPKRRRILDTDIPVDFIAEIEQSTQSDTEDEDVLLFKGRHALRLE